MRYSEIDAGGIALPEEGVGYTCLGRYCVARKNGKMERTEEKRSQNATGAACLYVCILFVSFLGSFVWFWI